MTLNRATYTLAWRRVAAWAVDWLIISAYDGGPRTAAPVAVDRSVRLPSLGWNAASFVVTHRTRDGVAGRMGKRPLGRHTRKASCSACRCGCREGDVGRRRARRETPSGRASGELGPTADM